jgi:hypothetical protein
MDDVVILNQHDAFHATSSRRHGPKWPFSEFADVLPRLFILSPKRVTITNLLISFGCVRPRNAK